MKKILNRIFVASMILAFIIGCKKTPELTYLKSLSFSSALTTSIDNVELTTNNDSATVIKLNWPAVDYGFTAPVKYTLQFTSPLDTLGANAWGKAKELVIGDNVLEKVFFGIELNDFAAKVLGLMPDSSVTVIVRTKSFVDRDVYSNSVAIKIKPHKMFTASKDILVLTNSNDQTEVVKFAWPKQFNPSDVVNYTLQFTPAFNATGDNAWRNPKDTIIGDDIYSAGFLGKEINNIALNGLSIRPGSATDVAIRVKASLNGTIKYSNTIIVNINPHELSSNIPSLRIPGDHQGWNPGAAPKIYSPLASKKFEGYVYFPAGGTFEFKMTPQSEWTPTAYGDNTGTSGNIIVANYAGGNMKVATAGYYELTADLNTNKWTGTKTTWSILGGATPGGWDIDTQMTYDIASGVWKVTCNMKAAGTFKFRANNQWVIDFGLDDSGKLAYANNPFYGYTAGRKELTVPSDGNYTITLNLKDATNYTYTLQKN